MPSERLSRWLARSGVASRRGSDRLVAEGRVTVNGEAPPPNGCLIDPDRDLVAVDGRTVSAARSPRRYLALNKPPGVVSTVSDPGGRPTVMGLVQDPSGLFPVGRLDLDSRGLILLTDDGDLALRLTHPRYGLPKTYRITIQGPVSTSEFEHFQQGPVLEDGPTHPISVKIMRKSSRRTVLEVALAEGRPRELRRMCAEVGVRLIDLERVEIAGVRLGTQPEGTTRELSSSEVARLRAAAGMA
ncbi:MAG: rRNA pseudouridine synthase [Candidatus Dormibacteraeota bacterium]|nr:rRNA pseudouridine synthase [Candidatus Dormibacteraeota bacterium]